MRVLSVRILIEGAPDLVEARLESCNRLLKLSNEANLPATKVEALVARALTYVSLSQAERAEQDFRQAKRIALEVGDAGTLGQAAIHDVFRAFWDGRLHDAEQLACAQVAADRDPVRARLTLLGRLFGVHYVRHGETQGRVTTVTLVEGAFPNAASTGCFVAAEQAHAGNLAAARSRFDALAADDFAAIPFGPGWLVDLATLALVPHLADDAERAALIYARLTPYAERSLVYALEALPGAPVSCMLGMLAIAIGDLRTAQRWFEQAVASCQRQNVPLLSHVVHSEYASLLLRRGSTADLRRARAIKNDLRAFAEAHGVGLLTVRAENIERALLGRLSPASSLRRLHADG
ncbi:MAG: hypothetical protein RLZZ450_3849 [Pseudomonadota bacterium]